ncbi:RNA-guided endonuclease InsQ/TnpB family protein [Paenibacillus pseudetheri]|uniref:IS200/IS605 family transposase ISDge19 n=1 Tax=Paenibacillus pseudetheri TaxID=2897682 RepID=A0ABM9BDU2_9BACL|nr:transposase [Paenibacillus pseudetheri]CAH1056391.1 IS200/IS605 family transposase ISDge19 [Paenibacillus pseudetheri]
MSTITAKIQIYVPDEQVDSLVITTNAYRKACNWLSAKVFETKELNQAKLNSSFYTLLRETFYLKSQMAQSVMKTVIARYKSAKSNGHQWSLITFKQLEYDLVWNRDYSLNKNHFSVNTLDGRLKFRFEKQGMKKYFDGTWKFGTAKLVHKFDKWFLHIPVTKTFEEISDTSINNVVGIDLGLNFLATTYDSQGKTKFFKGRTIKHKRGQFKAIRKQLQQCQTSSARKRLKKIGSRENRYVRDVNHQVTKALVEQYPKGTLFVLEDLSGVRNATEKVLVRNRYISVSWAFYQFREMLEYKAKLHSHKVMVADPKYTSQTCPKCGHVDKRNRNKKQHTFGCCNCHYKSNDDRIGAMNLYRKGVEAMSTVTS